MDCEQRYMSDLTGEKRALLIGIGYEHCLANTIKGAINDAKQMVNSIRPFNFKPENIAILTDEDKEAPLTKAHILEEMKKLVSGASANDSLFLFISGHGGQLKDKVGDEWDGKDEGLLVSKIKDASGEVVIESIIDDEMYDILVRNLPERCRLTAVFNCCHSGTILDLPYEYDKNGKEIIPESLKLNFLSIVFGKSYKPQINIAKRDPPKDVLCFAACKDSQVGLTLGADQDDGFGVFTYLFRVCILEELTFRNMLMRMDKRLGELKEAHKKDKTGIKVEMNPQFSSGYPIDLDTVFKF